MTEKCFMIQAPEGVHLIKFILVLKFITEMAIKI
jgi:hypothetical protein